MSMSKEALSKLTPEEKLKKLSLSKEALSKENQENKMNLDIGSIMEEIPKMLKNLEKMEEIDNKVCKVQIQGTPEFILKLLGKQ